jgi:hypothetical protein
LTGSPRPETRDPGRGVGAGICASPRLRLSGPPQRTSRPDEAARNDRDDLCAKRRSA